MTMAPPQQPCREERLTEDRGITGPTSTETVDVPQLASPPQRPHRRPTLFDKVFVRPR